MGTIYVKVWTFLGKLGTFFLEARAIFGKWRLFCKEGTTFGDFENDNILRMLRLGKLL